MSSGRAKGQWWVHFKELWFRNVPGDREGRGSRVHPCCQAWSSERAPSPPAGVQSQDHSGRTHRRGETRCTLLVMAPGAEKNTATFVTAHTPAWHLLCPHTAPASLPGSHCCCCSTPLTCCSPHGSHCLHCSHCSHCPHCSHCLASTTALTVHTAPPTALSSPTLPPLPHCPHCPHCSLNPGKARLRAERLEGDSGVAGTPDTFISSG